MGDDKLIVVAFIHLMHTCDARWTTWSDASNWSASNIIIFCCIWWRFMCFKFFGVLMFSTFYVFYFLMFWCFCNFMFFALFMFFKTTFSWRLIITNFTIIFIATFYYKFATFWINHYLFIKIKFCLNCFEKILSSYFFQKFFMFLTLIFFMVTNFF